MAGAAAWPVTKFLERYNTTDAYVVSNLDRYMAADVEIPELIKCGYATSYLDVNNFWFSSGNSDSVIHNDDQDNVNCVLSGTKRFFMVDPRQKNYVESEACGWTVASETGKGYGAYGGPPVIDSTNLDLKKFPRWKEVPWYDATVEAGDCLFIPTSWYHQARPPFSPPLFLDVARIDPHSYSDAARPQIASRVLRMVLHCGVVSFDEQLADATL